MYNLELAIENWRNGLLAQESILSENIEELEDHLRMSTSQLVKHGLSEDEAFLIASKRIGASFNLNIEFGKINSIALWIQRLRWMVLGILLFQAFSGIWTLFVKLTSEYLLVFSKSAMPSGVLFIVLSALLPVIVWIGLRGIAHADSALHNRLTMSSQFIVENQKMVAGFLASAFLIIPVAEIFLSSIVARNLSPQVFGEYSLVVSGYGLIARIFFPVFGILVLLWLNRSRNKYSTTK
jgi:hypothetical protein